MTWDSKKHSFTHSLIEMLSKLSLTAIHIPVLTAPRTPASPAPRTAHPVFNVRLIFVLVRDLDSR